MKIGSIDLGERPVLLAPMEDVTDIGFRLLCRKMGAAMVYSEFVSCDAITRLVKSTLQKLRLSDEERPAAVQIYGKDPQAMAEAARIVVEQAHPDVIDLNFGCPVKRVASKGAGAGLLQNIPLMLEIADAVVRAVDVPVTAKTRLGWDHQHLIINDLAERLQDVGIQVLTIHGRTRSQMYKGEADWTLIGEVKRNPRISIPIIGNGDIDTAEKARRAFEEYGVDAVMVGRASFGRPWIFKEIADLIHPERGLTGTDAIESEYPPMSPDWKLDVLKEQVRQSIERIDEYRGILHIRRHLAATPLFKGIPNFREHRIAMLRADTCEELFRLMEETRPLIRKAAAEEQKETTEEPQSTTEEPQDTTA
jgi:tRNA-dihydrouridine synthase B